MELLDFDYNLPKELIAQYPLKERSKARLLVLERKTGLIRHSLFSEILDYIEEDELLVFNNSRVIPARIKGRRITGGKVEVLLLRKIDSNTFKVLIKPSRLKCGEKIIFEENGILIEAKVLDKNHLQFIKGDLEEILKIGKMPLPPYIKREPTKEDFSDYQTIYATEDGSIASPTAGLHFDEEIFKNIEAKKIKFTFVTLHIGYSSFKPLKERDITSHKLDEEYFKIDDSTLKLIKETKIRRKRIFAVGTTSVRTLETYAHRGISEGYTDLYIYPGFEFKLVDCLITNFHLPRTSLFILVCAFAGIELIKKAYNEAIREKYRFLSYGDAMLII